MLALFISFSAIAERCTPTVIPAGCDTPQITLQPVSVTACVGQSAQFELEAEGTNLTYLWYIDTLEFDDDGPFIGFSNLVLADTGFFYCVITGACGTITSDTVQLIVEPSIPIAITAHPQDTTVCDGGSAGLVVQQTGGTSYQWNYNGVPQSVNSPLLALNQLGLSDGGPVYCTVANACNSANSTTATIAVLPEVEWLQQPQSLLVDSGDTASLFMLASGSNLVYQWWHGTDTVLGSDSLIVASITSMDTGMYYYQVASDCGTLLDSIQIVLNLPSAVPGLQADGPVRIWPNPTTGHAQMLLPRGTVSVEIRDEAGRLLAHHFEPLLRLHHIYLPNSGRYYLRILTETAVFTQSVVVIAK